MRHQQKRFMSKWDLLVTPMVESVLLLLAAGSVYVFSTLFADLRALECLLLGYLMLVVWTLLALKLLRAYFPVVEGIYTVSSHPRAIFLWNLYGFLCILNLSPFYTNNLLPIPLRQLFLALLGADLGKGVLVIGGLVCDPHLVTIEENVILGDECYLTPHAILSLSSGDALYIKRIHLKKNCIIGARAVIMPGVTVEEDAMVPANALIAMNAVVTASASKVAQA